MLAPTAPREIARDLTVIVDHLGMVPASQGVNDPNFHALLKLVGDGHAYVKLSAVYRLSTQFPDYPDAKPLHDALVAANPERLTNAARAVSASTGHRDGACHADKAGEPQCRQDG
jgi:predicted TIM-barrel fold metal-dependent hydrolase